MNASPITEEDLHAWMDGLLDPEREGEVRAYLDAHPDVAARFEGYRACDAALRACLADVAEEPVPARLDVARMVGGRPRMRPAAMDP